MEGKPAQSRLACGLAAMETSRIDGSLATVVGVQGGLAMRSIEMCGSDEQKAYFLPRISRGELHFGIGYSEPDEAYRTALTGWFSRRYGWQVEAEWNTVTPGVVPALALAVRALTAPGETVLIEEPVYYPFRDVVEVNKRTVAAVPLAGGVFGHQRSAGAVLFPGLRLQGKKRDWGRGKGAC